MRPELGRPLTEAEAQGMINEGERVFALSCLEVGCEVFYQIRVGSSNIDFLVINPKAYTRGKLVEVTMEKREDLEKKFITKTKGNKKIKVTNDTGKRKLRQIESMRQSGMKWTILFDREIQNLKNR